MRRPADIGADIARVTAIVEEANEKRLVVEHELKAAQAAVESLKVQSTSLGQSVLDIQQQLESALKRKAVEEADLVEIAERKKKALYELTETLTLIEALRKEHNAKSAIIDSNLEKSRAELVAVESGINETKKGAASATASATELRQRLAAVRESADRVEAQLGSILEMTSATVDAAYSASSRTAEAFKAVDLADQCKVQALQACQELGSMTETLQTKRGELDAKVAQIEEVVADRAQPTEALTSQLSALAEIIGAVLKPKSSPQQGDGAAAHKAANQNAAPNGSRHVAHDGAAASEGSKRSTGQTAESPSPALPQSAADQKAAKHFASYMPAIRTIQLLASEKAIGFEEAARFSDMLREGRVDDALRTARARGASGAQRLIAGSILQASGDTRRAHEAYVDAASVRDTNVMIRYLATLALQDLGKLDEALKVGHAISNDNAGAVLWRNLIGLHQRLLGRPDEAQRMFNEALEMTGFPLWQYNETLYNMGELLESKNELAQALSFYERLHANNPKYRDVSARIAASKGRKSDVAATR